MGGDGRDVRHGNSISRRPFGRPSQAEASVVADANFGTVPLGPPTGDDVGSLCIWVGATRFSRDNYDTPTIAVVMLKALREDEAVIRTLLPASGIDQGFVE